MEMSDREIVLSYSQAKRKAPQIGILAQLNACRRDRIVAILERHGVYKPKPKVPRTPGKPWSPEEDRRLLQLAQEGLSREELTGHFPGRTVGAISTRMTKMGIKKRPSGGQDRKRRKG